MVISEKELTANTPYIIDEFRKRVGEAPNAAFLVNPATNAVVSRKQADVMSGRLCAYLQKKGIGRESRVMICLPRGELCFLAALGVIKAGAAFTLVEDTYPEERIDYIRRDFGCDLFLDLDSFNEAMCEEPTESFERPDDHDLCIAVYTSGTTGDPKGVMHEYGALRLNYKAHLEYRSLVGEGFSYTVVSPLNFAASLIYMIQGFYWCDELHILPYSTVKNPELLAAYCRDRKIDVSFISPSLLRVVHDKLDSRMRLILLGGEPSHGIYLDNIGLYSLYAMSESLFPLLSFKIDRMYDICPSGRPTSDLPIVLLDESGNETADGELGEICFNSPFFRGYIGQPEAAKKAFRYGVFHTGDLAVRTSDGNYFIKGRSDDMIKINGNRIEPAEIEAAAKNILNINWCGIKGFAEKQRSYLCLYYTEELSMDISTLRSELEKRLPYYMIPSYYIKLDEIPTNANGKFSRKLLQAPDISEYFKEYAAPTNELEKQLCTAFEEILKLPRIGIDDDFFDLGGDSISAMSLTAALGIEGITAMDIFRERTPAAIAAAYDKKSRAAGVSPEERELEARKGEYPLTAFQLNMFDYQLYNPRSCTWNLPMLFTMRKDAVDIGRFEAALNRTAAHHTVFRTLLRFNENGHIVQYIDDDALSAVETVKCTDEVFAGIKDRLNTRFTLIGKPLIYMKLYETESRLYLLFMSHHIMIDGMGIRSVLESVKAFYNGTEPPMDMFYTYLDEEQRRKSSRQYLDSKQYFEQTYGGRDWCRNLTPAVQVRENLSDGFSIVIKPDKSRLEELEKQYHLSRSGICAAIALLTLHDCENKDKVLINWVFHNRTDQARENSSGLMIKLLPIGVEMGGNIDTGEVFKEVSRQITGGIAHSACDWCLENEEVFVNDAMFVVYESSILDMPAMDQFGASVEFLADPTHTIIRRTSMQIIDVGDEMHFMFYYLAGMFSEEQTAKLRSGAEKYIRLLLLGEG